MPNFGFSDKEWQAAKDEAKEILIERAKVRGKTISYSELVTYINAIQLEAHDIRLNHLVGEISKEEDAAGRGMLSVLVVHRHGDKQPGPGFFELAEELGRDTSDILECWVKELQKVHAYWEGQKPK